MRCTGGGTRRRTMSRSQCLASSHRAWPWSRNAGEVNHSTINLLILKTFFSAGISQRWALKYTYLIMGWRRYTSFSDLFSLKENYTRCFI